MHPLHPKPMDPRQLETGFDRGLSVLCWGFLTVTIVQYTPKPYSNYSGPYSDQAYTPYSIPYIETLLFGSFKNPILLKAPTLNHN